MSARVLISLRLPVELVEWADRRAGRLGVTRTSVLEGAVSELRRGDVEIADQEAARVVRGVGETYGAMVEGGAW